MYLYSALTSIEYKHKEFYNAQNKTKLKAWMLSYMYM